MTDMGNKVSEDEGSQSPVLPTKYANRSAKMVRSIEKNFYLVIGIASGVLIVSVLDLVNAQKILHIFIDPIVTIFSAASIAVLLYNLVQILKSRRILENWADVFERNSIRAGMNISMANRSKEEALRAVSETIEEIGEPLRKYISSKDNYSEFFDIAFDKKDKSEGNRNLVFDVLIDVDRIESAGHSSTDALKQVIREYGAVIIKIVNGVVDRDAVVDFSELLSRYTSLTNNKVSLALLIGEEATADAHNLSLYLKNKKIGYMILIEKPVLLS
jgi:hypothetical protein